jgi:hypothetical protein
MQYYMEYHLKCNPNNSRVQRYRNEIRSCSLWVMDSLKFPCDTRVVIPVARLLLLPGTQDSRGKCMFILEHYVAPKSFDAVHEAFSNACPVGEVLNKSTYRLLTKFRDTLTVYERRCVQRQQHYQAVHSTTQKKHQADCRENLRENCHKKVNYLCNSCDLDCILNDTPYTIQPFATHVSWSNRRLNKISSYG